MNEDVARKGNRWYAVIYDGTDPVTGTEKRTWHAAGTTEATPSGSLRVLRPTSVTTKRARSRSAPT